MHTLKPVTLRRSIWLAALRLVLVGKACAAPTDQPPLDPLILRGALSARARPVAQSDTGVVVVFNSSGMGSGFVVSKDGAVLTNAHVVGRSRRLKVRWSDGSESQARLLRINRKLDAALIQVADDHHRPLPLRTRLPNVGDTVFAIGTPLDLDLQGTLSRGIVSAIRKVEGGTLIQSDVSITHGNSGGPLLDEKGNVVGMAVSGLDNTSANLNFFIPVTEILAGLNLKPGS